MIDSNATVYEQAITTDRPAEMLARRHGFESVSQLAESLPENARVLDVGAGASPFGKEVAALRPDITWTNFDYSYHDPAILGEVTQGAPSNIEFVAGDATRLAEAYEPETFDAVFSYWLLPHLSIDNPEPALAAAKAIFNVTKSGGLISVGPQARRGGLLSIQSGKAVQVIKDEEQAADTYAEQILSTTKLPKSSRYVQKLANEVATPFFGTTRYTRRDGKRLSLYHPESGEYVPPFSRRGMTTTGRLMKAAASYTTENNEDKVRTMRNVAIGAVAIAAGVTAAHYVLKQRSTRR